MFSVDRLELGAVLVMAIGLAVARCYDQIGHTV